jgi:hypothetical protein
MRLLNRIAPIWRVGEGFADLARRKQALTPGFAVPSPPGEGRYQLRPTVNPNVETGGYGKP